MSSRLKSKTGTNEVGNYFFGESIRGLSYIVFIAVVDKKSIGHFNTELSSKKAINKAQGFKSKTWNITYE
jgi:hypothetical protein